MDRLDVKRRPTTGEGHAPTRTKSAGITKRERILRAAMTLFGQYEFAEISGRDIAAEAEVSTQLIWYHFGSKEKLRSEIDDRIVDIVTAPLASLSGDLEEKLGVYYQAVWAALEDYGPPFAYYYRRMLLDEGERGYRLYDTMMAGAKRIGLFSGIRSGSKITKRNFETAIIGLFVSATVLKPHVEKKYGKDFHSHEEFRNRAKVITSIIQKIAK